MLAGKTAMVTGGLGTIGMKTSSALIDAGANVIIVDKEEQSKGGASCSKIGSKCSYETCDLSAIESIAETIEHISSRHGEIDILINNAALIINKPFEDFSASEYEDQLRVNAAAAFSLVKACAPSMKRNGYGKIVNLTSLTLNGRWEGYVPYVASKGAMLGLTKGLARELGPFGINVNAVAPGAVVSDAEERVFGDRAKEYSDWIIENQSLKKRIQPEDVAELVVFLCTEKSNMISGQNIGVDGGW